MFFLDTQTSNIWSDFGLEDTKMAIFFFITDREQCFNYQIVF